MSPKRTPKSRRSESRRSSILKPRKPRQPFQNVNFDSPLNEKGSTPSKTKRRVSFAEKKHVKEFCHSVEQGTVWDNTYEEHDASLKSFVADSNAKTESTENASLCTSKNECIHICESNSSYPNNSNLTNNQLSESIISVKENDNESCDMTFTNPIKCTELFDEGSQREQTILPNKSAIPQASKNAILNDVLVCSNIDEKHIEPSDERSQLEQNVMLNALSISHVSNNATASNIIIFRDSDEENGASTNNTSTNNISTKSYSESHFNNVDSELDRTCAQDLSMEFTAPVPTFLLPSHAAEQINVQKDDNTLRLNLHTNYISNCNNVSIQAVPTSVKPVNSDLGIFEQISEIQNRGNASLSTENNTHDKTIFSTNLQSNIASKNTVFKQTEDATQNVTESMVLTTVIQPSTTSTDMSCTNNTSFNTSMEITAAVSSKMYDKIISHPYDENIIKKNDLRENETDKTEFFNDVMMEMTKPVNVLPLIVYDKENLRMDELISKDDGTVFFQNVSMEMTNVLLKNQEEITQPIIHKSISEESTCKEKNMDNSIGFNEKTMEFTEAVPVSLHHERTLNTICTTSFSQTMPKACSPVENSAESTLQADTVANKTIQHVLMEITATDSSTLHLRDATNERENLIISEDNEFQHLTTNNLTESRKSATKENDIISREIVETTDAHDELPNISVIPSSTNNLDHSLNAVLKNNSRKKTLDEDEQPNPKKFCSSFMESHTIQENNVRLSPRPNDNYINDTGYNECLVKDIMDHTGLSRSNFRDNLEISECNLLRKSLENNIIELQSIKPPSFILLDSDKEENSFLDALHEDKLQISTCDGTINNMHNSSNQLITNNVTEYECLTESRKSVTKDNESFTILRENEPINIENNQMEDCCRRTVANETEDNQEIDCQVIRRTIINDNRINESNYTTNVENPNEESILLTQNDKHEETNTDHCTSPVIKESEVIDEERINDTEPRNNIKEKEEYSDVQRLEIEQCTDHFKRTEVIENQSNSEEYCKENLNDEVRRMQQKEECIEERLAAEQCVSVIEDESFTEQDPFLLLSQKLETHGERDDCIWNVYHKNTDRKMIVFGFISNSLLIATFLSYDFNCSGENLIEKIRIVSRVSDDSGVLVRIVHKLILEKLDDEILMYLYRTHEDILPMLECVSQDVKLAMDFMFDLKRLDDLNLMEIAYNEISFLSRSKQMGIILKVTIKVKRFDKLTSNDINVHCLLGTIRETDVKSLIKNIKKDHKFLRRYMNDVKDYIDIMEETLIAKRPIDL
ncbi:hypothetical protein RF55_3047 [Lasius niger]|uniref:Uncharacterized protein n=1 Tax=Lasius niger TaxID=67767 RepID=A0A0J7NW75_LASNI|nr:hypothetical protein RF55_3047 [Lasius niger]